MLLNYSLWWYLGMPAAPLMLQQVVHGDVTEDQSVNAHYNISLFTPYCIQNQDCRLFNPMIVALN